MRRGLALALIWIGCSKNSAPAAPPPPPPGLNVQLPPRARTSGAEVGGVAQITIGRDDQVFVNGLAMANDEAVTAKLRELRAQTPSIEVHLLSDPGVPYARVINAIAAVRNAGIVNMSFDSPQGPKPDPK